MYELVGLYFVELRIRLITKVVFGFCKTESTKFVGPTYIMFVWMVFTGVHSINKTEFFGF